MLKPPTTTPEEEKQIEKGVLSVKRNKSGKEILELEDNDDSDSDTDTDNEENEKNDPVDRPPQHQNKKAKGESTKDQIYI